MKKIEVGTSIQADRRCNQAAQPATTCQDGKEGGKDESQRRFFPNFYTKQQNDATAGSRGAQLI